MRSHGTSTSLFFLWLVFQLHVTSTVGVGYMTTLASLSGYIPMYTGTNAAACALEVGTLFPRCWSSTSPIFGDILPPVNMSFWAISNGIYFVCGLLYQSHNPFCWGQVNTSVISSQFQSTSYSNINSGGFHACAVRDNKTDSPGRVDCWGTENTYGQASPPSEAMISVTAGDYFTCGLSATTRRTICWGSNFTQGDSRIQAPNTSFESIFAGSEHICGIELDTRKTLCWGNNTFGQAQPPENLNFTVITGGPSFSCGLREDTHEAVCWGDTSDAQTSAPPGVAFAAISSADWFTCGVREDSQKMIVNCWGSNNKANSYVPTALRASMGLCVNQCKEGQYEFPDSKLGISNLHQCPKNGDKMCLECLPGQCQSPAPVSLSHPIKGIVLGVALPVIAALIGLLAVLRCRQLRSMWLPWRRLVHEKESAQTMLWKAKANKVVSFSSEELRIATKDYDNGMIIGKGGFGDVYKGILGDGRVVAIKKACTMERASSFDMELELLAQLNHTHLMNLLGYCEMDKCLVFEFMANGSLLDCLFGSAKQPLDCKDRMKIALQAARGLEYLHVYASPQIIHRDVKASNILLDEALDAHISDFGLSLYGPVGSKTHLSNQTPCGTPGYLDPEYFQSFQLTTKSDVYSYGVVLLELLSGRKAVDINHSVPSIVVWATELAEQEKSMLILDSEMKIEEDNANCKSIVDVIGLALRCVRMTGKERPTMSEVANLLQQQVGVEPFLPNPNSPLRDHHPSVLRSNSKCSNADFSCSLEAR